MSNYTPGLLEGVLPHIIYPSTVSDEQARLAAALDATNANISSSNCKLDDSAKTSWGLFYAAARGFTKESPGLFGLGGMMDRAQKYEDELVSWQQKLSATCDVGPIYQPASPPNILSGLQYLMWAAVAVGGAYGVGKIISVIPKPTSKQLPPKRR